MDTEIDGAIVELIHLKDYDFMGIDVRIRDGKPTTYHVANKEEQLPENTSDDEIARLKEKLELLKKIDEMMEKLKKYDKEPIYVPYPAPYNPWVNPWSEPWITWKTDTADDTAKINWAFPSSGGK